MRAFVGHGAKGKRVERLYGVRRVALRSRRAGLSPRRRLPKKVEYVELRRAVINLAARDHPNAMLIEDKGSGTSLLQDLRSNTSLPVIPIEPDGDKIFRAGEVSPIVESGRLLLPTKERRLGWPITNPNYWGFQMPSAHKDQVDETTQFLKWVGKSGGEYSHIASGQKLKSHQNVTVGKPRFARLRLDHARQSERGYKCRMTIAS